MTLICFGDSNTWGYDSRSYLGGRYDEGTRWPCLLSSALGAEVRELGETLGFAAKPKDYKKNPDQFKGHVGDVSQVIRLAITGRTNSPDLCSVMQILGEATCQQRLDEAIATLSK